MIFSLNGISVPHRKNTVGKTAERMPAPKSVTIPMSMHIGAPATPVVKVGDKVKVGSLIAEATGFVSVPIHSSVSGTVKKLIEILTSSGKMTPAIVIESDGEMALDERISAPSVSSAEELIEAVRASGIVGLGGAGFPTHVKLRADMSGIDYLIVNGAECEPYITSDTLTMTERCEDMANGIRAIQKHLGIKSVIFGIEANKKRAVECVSAMAQNLDGVSVKVLPSVYPQGGEKVLVYHTTGRVIKVGKLPADVGCIVLNCTTLAAIGKYLADGIPLVEKCITVDGGAVASPMNVIAPVGTSMEDVFAFCGGLTSSPAKLVYGGPMMGVTVPDITAPILKNTNAILALTEREARLPKTTNCIRCGSCTNTCPFGIAPAGIEKALRKKDADRIEALEVDACMECGCCSFVCPANRPLVQSNKLAKQFLREVRAKEALEKARVAEEMAEKNEVKEEGGNG